jgi:hypothetical protein
VIGVVLLGVVAFRAFSIIGDPGGNYDSWVPEEEVSNPEASFDWESSGLSVQFTDTSEIGDTEIVRWMWEFDDGTTSDQQNPTHRFGEEAQWQVTLDVVDEDGLTSKAEGEVGIERGSNNSGEGAIGLSDMADKVIGTVERAAKGSLVVVLVIGLFIVLAIVGGRMISNGVRMLRPMPKRITVKLRPKELELAMLEAKPEIVDAKAIEPIVLTSNEDESTDILEPV